MFMHTYKEMLPVFKNLIGKRVKFYRPSHSVISYSKGPVIQTDDLYGTCYFVKQGYWDEGVIVELPLKRKGIIRYNKTRLYLQTDDGIIHNIIKYDNQFEILK